MIISRTPYRISFFGGGTDYPDYYLKHGGKVLGTAINKYCYLNVRKLPPFFDFKHRIVYSNQENVIAIDEIDHPAVREVFRYLDIKEGKSIHHDGDIPARSGMGSSSAFTVGLIKSLMALRGRYISKRELAEKTIYVEQEMIKENVGSQDQTFAAYGGLNKIDFLKNGKIAVSPVIMDPERLKDFESHLMIFFSGVTRNSSDIAMAHKTNISNNIDKLNYMKNLVDIGYNILTDGKYDLLEFGHLLNETWNYKKKLSTAVSNGKINTMYDIALEAGAVGGKLLGAGGGGFILLFVQPEKQSEVKAALKDYLHIPFRFDFSGCKIIVYEPNYNGN